MAEAPDDDSSSVLGNVRATIQNPRQAIAAADARYQAGSEKNVVCSTSMLRPATSFNKNSVTTP